MVIIIIQDIQKKEKDSEVKILFNLLFQPLTILIFQKNI